MREPASTLARTLILALAAAVISAILVAPPLAGQGGPLDLEGILRHRTVKLALDRIDRSEPRAVATLIALASVVSPSGREHERAKLVADRMRAIGL